MSFVLAVSEVESVVVDNEENDDIDVTTIVEQIVVHFEGNTVE